MQKNKKTLLIIGGMLAVSSVLLLSMFSDLSESNPEQQVQEVSLRANVTDVSLSDMMNTVEKRNTSNNDNASQGLIYSNQPANTSQHVDDPEAVARVQALIRANQENLSSGLQDIENERQGIVTTPPEPSSKRKPETSLRQYQEQYEDTDREEESEEVDSAENVEPVEPSKPSPFHTIALTNSTNRNAIKAYVHSEQVVMAGSTLKMRLGEPAYTDNGVAVPKNSPVFGMVTSIDGERVNVEITSINVNGNILPFKKEVYSKDALLGIYVPGNPKAEATKDVTGGALDGLPTSGIPGVDAATRIAGVVASSAANAGKQALSKNVRKIKVTIKTNYEIYLRPEENK